MALRRVTPTLEQAVAVTAMRVDAVSAEVGRAFARAGVKTILLKGPTVAELLYRDGAPRPYGDSDLLVALAQRPGAEAALEAMGFSRALDDADTPGWRQVAHHWGRSQDAADVDLHWTLTGVGSSAEALWETLSAETEPMRVHDFTFDVLSIRGRALLIALHAAQHGIRSPAPLEDLRRALELLDEETWLAACELARALEALPAFASGLELLEPGRALAARLPLPAETTLEARLLATSPPPGAMGIEHLARASGGADRARIVARKLVPTRRFMRAWSPLARRGSLGLGAAYLGRPLWLVAKAPSGVRAWLRARSGS